MSTVNSQSNLLADICEKYYNYVNTICFDELYQNKELAYDVTQDTFMELCTQWDRLNKTNIKAWLRSTALHKVKQIKARYKKSPEYLDIDSYLPNEPNLIENIDIMAKIIDDVINRDIEKYQNQIYERLRNDEVEISKYLNQGLSQLEISERMNVSYGAVRMTVIRLRDKVAKIIDEINSSVMILILVFIIYHVIWKYQ